MKKLYNQPSMEVMALMPTTIICASITAGPGIGSGDPPEYGD